VLISANFSLVEVKKLEGSSNYILWEIKPIIILKKENLWDVIKESFLQLDFLMVKKMF
jgi:hypothetical protein